MSTNAAGFLQTMRERSIWWLKFDGEGTPAWGMAAGAKFLAAAEHKLDAATLRHKDIHELNGWYSFFETKDRKKIDALNASTINKLSLKPAASADGDAKPLCDGVEDRR